MLCRVPDRALEHLVPRGLAEIGRHRAREILVSDALPPGIQAPPHAVAEIGDRRARPHLRGRRNDEALIGQGCAGVLGLEVRGRDLKDVVHQHAVRAGPVRQLLIEPIVRHLPHQADGRFEYMVAARVQLGRRKGRARLLVETQKLDDIADHLGKYETVAARHDRHGTRTQPPQLLQAALIRQHIDRLELDPTDREVFLNPEAARSMRLPKHRDWFVHLSLGRLPGRS